MRDSREESDGDAQRHAVGQKDQREGGFGELMREEVGRDGVEWVDHE